MINENQYFQQATDPKNDKDLVKVGQVAESIMERLGFSHFGEKDIRRAPSSFFQVNTIDNNNKNNNKDIIININKNNNNNNKIVVYRMMT